MKIEELEKIVKILRQNDITEFELNHDGTHIKLSRSVIDGRVVQTLKPVEVEPAVLVPSNGTAEGKGKAVDEVPPAWVAVESPIVGTFYRKPAPDADPFVKEGDVVKKGDTLCIIEAMKLMNEIEATASGRVEKVLLKDGQVVEFGEKLFLINPDA
ncbi:MAG: acetyl-CoA carboxylase biotin carboxyl carrier protein [Bdellovibrionales bacterium]|nr:acetyl-CoA carboxylase biotin carboxyl carrier protein [Bdellovibrionales bacterium]